jgi:hypothetical protein
MDCTQTRDAVRYDALTVLLPTLRKKTRRMGHPQCQDAERVSHPPMNYARTYVGEQRGDIWELNVRIS